MSETSTESARLGPWQFIISDHHVSDNELIQFAGGQLREFTSVADLDIGMRRTSNNVIGVCREGAIELLQSINKRMRKMMVDEQKKLEPQVAKK
ncbi:MAG: hypothetical protein HOO67_02920 [Candidatus Peribacteraceae bacterium]|nr:hypothetical protein [Candidatus Peribacteraceae bacterium]